MGFFARRLSPDNRTRKHVGQIVLSNLHVCALTCAAISLFSFWTVSSPIQLKFHFEASCQLTILCKQSWAKSQFMPWLAWVFLPSKRNETSGSERIQTLYLSRTITVHVTSSSKPIRLLASCNQERIRGRNVQLPYNRVYYRSLKSAAVRCCYSELGPFFALCSSLLPAFTSIHASSYSFPTKTSER